MGRRDEIGPMAAVAFAEAKPDADQLRQRRLARRSFDLPDQRICADLDPEPAHQALAGTSSEGTPYCGDDLAGSLGLERRELGIHRGIRSRASSFVVTTAPPTPIV